MTGHRECAHAAAERMSRAGRTFYLAARLLPGSVRDDVVQLYAFCRTVDDLADNPASPLAERWGRLEALERALERGYVPALRAAGWPFAATGPMAQAAGALVRAAIGDLAQKQPETEADVLDYAFGVAGTVGLMMAQVLGADPSGYGAAVALGMAMQLSNICRDVAEDLHAGRIYLPSSSVSADTLACAIHQGAAAEVDVTLAAVHCLLARADLLYEAAWDGIASLPWRTRWSILSAGMCYREIGVSVARDAPRSWRRRVVVGTLRKLWLVAVAAVRLLLPRFRQVRPARVPLPFGQVASGMVRSLEAMARA